MAEGDTATALLGPLDVRRVMQLLPHRYPMLLVDRVVSMELGKSIHAVKAVSMNEPFGIAQASTGQKRRPPVGSDRYSLLLVLPM